MANREAKLIERTLKDFSLGALNGNDGGSSLYTYYVLAKNDSSYEYGFTFQCDNPELDSYDKLAQYLLSKGYYSHLRDDGHAYCPILSAVSDRTFSYNAVNGLFVDNTSLADGQLLISLSILYVSSGSLYTSTIGLPSSDTFEITLVAK